MLLEWLRRCNANGWAAAIRIADVPILLAMIERGVQTNDDLAAHAPAMAQAHPEDHCQRCGGPNVIWFAPNELWNRVVGSPNGILCPVCFIKMAEAMGISTTWRLEPEDAINLQGAK